MTLAISILCLVVLLASFIFDRYEQRAFWRRLRKLEEGSIATITKQNALIEKLENRVKELSATQDTSEDWKKMS